MKSPASNATRQLRGANGQFISTTVTILRDGTRGKNNRKLALHRRTKYTKKPKGFVLSDIPRGL